MPADLEELRRAAQALGLPATPDWPTLSYQGYGSGGPLTQAGLDRILALYLKRWGGRPPRGLLVLVHQGNGQAAAAGNGDGNGKGHGDELHLAIAGCQIAIVDAAGLSSPRLHQGDVLICPPAPVGSGAPAASEKN